MVRVGDGVVIPSTDRDRDLVGIGQSTGIRHGVGKHIGQRLAIDPQGLDGGVRFIDDVGIRSVRVDRDRAVPPSNT